MFQRLNIKENLMAKIKNVKARQIIDCKCRPMVEADIEIEGGFIGRGSAPTGSSVGIHEAFVLRDGNQGEYGGLSVHKAVDNVNNIIGPAILDMNVEEQKKIDLRMIELDGTDNKSNLGGNAVYSVSVACLRAASRLNNIPTYKYICGRDIHKVPVPSFNVINGGRYGDIVQPCNEFIIIPYGADDVSEAVEIAVKCFQKLEYVLAEYQMFPPIIARSYGWAAPSCDPETVLELISKTVELCGYTDRVAFALDCASSEMFDEENNTYLLKDRRVSAEELIEYAKKLSEKFPLLFIEDLLNENDWENYPKATRSISRSIMIGDDLVATRPDFIRRAYETGAIDGFVFKPNQVGTITEALDTHYFAKQHGLLSVPSGRSGGVVKDIVMDFAVGLEVDFIKNGAPRSGERIDKLNFLMRACDLSPGCRMADLSKIIRF
jgi:enolase